MTSRSAAGTARDEGFMREAIAEAQKGVGRTHPNPPVGAVVVKNGMIVGRGFHPSAGQPHGEVFALREAGEKARGAEVYVTLEPCNHFGRTPPCTLALIEAGVKRVVTGSKDPSPWIKNNLARLRRAGIEVITGILRAETDLLNRPFFKRVLTGLPWVTLKAAVSLDGKLAIARGLQTWLTGEASRLAVHRLRDQADVVMVGAGTVRADNPRLNTRLPKGSGRDPTRLVLSSDLKLDPGAFLFTQPSTAPTIVATLQSERSKRARQLSERGARIWQLKGLNGEEDRVPLEPLLRRLAEAGHMHVMVEGGAELHTAFIEAGLADELWLFVAPKLVGAQGLPWLGPLDLGRRAMPKALAAMDASPCGEDLLVKVRLSKESLPTRETSTVLRRTRTVP